MPALPIPLLARRTSLAPASRAINPAEVARGGQGGPGPARARRRDRRNPNHTRAADGGTLMGPAGGSIGRCQESVMPEMFATWKEGLAPEQVPARLDRAAERPLQGRDRQMAQADRPVEDGRRPGPQGAERSSRPSSTTCSTSTRPCSEGSAHGPTPTSRRTVRTFQDAYKKQFKSDLTPPNLVGDKSIIDLLAVNAAKHDRLKAKQNLVRYWINGVDHFPPHKDGVSMKFLVLRKHGEGEDPPLPPGDARRRRQGRGRERLDPPLAQDRDGHPDRCTHRGRLDLHRRRVQDDHRGQRRGQLRGAQVRQVRDRDHGPQGRAQRRGVRRRRGLRRGQDRDPQGERASAPRARSRR